MRACTLCYTQNQDDNLYCSECQAPMTKAQASAQPKPYPTDALGIIWYDCVHVDRGQRCTCRGTLSMGTLSTGPSGKDPPDPRYCYLHFPPFKGRYHGANNSPPPQGFDHLRNILAKHQRQPTPPNDQQREPGEEG